MLGRSGGGGEVCAARGNKRLGFWMHSAFLTQRLYDECVGPGCSLQRAADGAHACVLRLPRGPGAEPVELYCDL